MADQATALERVFAPQPPPLAGALAAGPYNFQFTGEDFLRLTAFNSLTGVRVAVHYRTAPTPTTTQTNRVDLAATSDRLATTKDFSVGEGYLLNVSVIASGGAPVVGQTFVKVQVIRGLGAAAIVMGTVVQGYITANQDLAWPGSPIVDSLSVEPPAREYSGTQPAAGIEIAETVPAGARWELLTLRVPFTTAVGGADRDVQLFISRIGVVSFFAVVPPASQAAATSYAHSFGAGLVNQSSAFIAAVQSSFPARVALTAGASYVTQTLNLAAGDQFGIPRLLLREWLEAA